ncbi:NCS2 family permease, partial [Burkholderia multivorans]
ADNDSGRDTAPVEHGSPSALDRFFEITQRGSSVRQEIRGGIVAFVAMAYIVVLNPLILGGSADVTGGTLDFAQLTAVTGLVAGLITILFGVVARLP